MPKGTINGEPYEVPDGYDVVHESRKQRGDMAVQLLNDLDRSPHGRHKGDVESQDPSGVSQGNPLLPPGTHIGYSLYGNRRIVVPDIHDLANAEAWYEEPESEDSAKGKGLDNG